MRGRGLGSLRGNAGLNCDDRLLLGDTTYGVNEFPSIDYVLDVQENDLGHRVRVKIFENVVLIHIGFVSHADELGESNVLPTSIVQDRFSQSTALRSEGNRSLYWHSRGEGSVEPHIRISIDYPQTIGTNHPHRILLRNRGDLTLEFCSVRAHFLESGRDNDKPLHSFLPGLFNNTRYCGSGNDHDR